MNTEEWYVSSRKPLEDGCTLEQLAKKIDICHMAQQSVLNSKLLEGYEVVGYPKIAYVWVLGDPKKFVEMKYVATLKRIGDK